ncbi:hypothetical protein [Methylovirgula sp. HY1]|uniref:hypothetical protein n=1 Tax=Methylovirgula sp. HY1 TaxID=2822761 RepID=UPI001C5A5B33|nr:hypothetical protein [Methylovirgula sp. HY1]QXX75227.1 hypothetical protein MHY1_02046 [Methylovirgula sp. HY1]
MNQQDHPDSQIDRTRIDGGFSFAVAAFALGLGLLTILERIGLPDKVLRIGVIALIFAGLVITVVFLRTMRPMDYYAGGRRLPATYAGLAFAGVAFGVFLPFLPPSSLGIGLDSAGVGFGIGCLWALFATGPILRRSGAYSFGDLIASRFPHLLVRVPIVLVMGFCAGCIALGGDEIALRGLIAATGVNRALGAPIVAGLLILLIVPAGLSGVVWTAAAATVVTTLALILPLGRDLLSGAPMAFPIFGDQAVWTQAVAHFAVLTDASRQTAFRPGLVVAIGLGVATLAPLFGATIATRDEGAAWRSGLIGMIWLALGTLLMAATIAGATLALQNAVGDRPPAALPRAILAASAQGDIALCGVHSSDPVVLDLACRANTGSDQPRPAWQHMRTNARYLLRSLPFLRGSEPTLTRLAAAFMIVLGIATAAAGIQCLATALSHDILHPRRQQFAVVSRRLAITRLLTIAASILVSLWLARHSVDVPVLFTFALMLSAALVAPLLVLALMPQPTSIGALAALCLATFVTAHFALFGTMTTSADEFAANAIFAAVDGIAVGLFVTFLPKRKNAS